MFGLFDSEADIDQTLLVIAVVMAVAVGVTGVYSTQSLTTQLTEAQKIIAENKKDLQDLQTKLAEAREENEELAEELEEAEEKNEDFEKQIEDITDKVGKISRYTSVDPELLKKYSRVYFLSENYVPSDLEEIDDEYVHGDDEEQFHDDALPFLEDMIEDAENDDIDLRIISAYRSFKEQQTLNNSYSVTYGAGTANQFSAEQGYSEHQLGTTVDLTTPELGDNFEQFDTTQAFEWMQDNAHEYGFVLSYPQGNQYYQYEPWHWRFVGVDLAEDLDDAGDHFYDWEQRRIDEYRGKIFQD